ncbi:ARID DNA-binding domain-containing protein, partial [Tanacetum coccineum]
MPGPIPPIINGTEIHLMDLYKLIEGLGGYLSVYFEQKFGTIGEILGLSKQDEEDVNNCYIKYLDIFTSYYKTARVPNQDQRSNLDIPARTLEVGKGYTCPTTHQWDFGESSAPILEVTIKNGKEKMEHFGIKLEEEKEYHGRKHSHPMQPNKGSILYNDTKIKEEETSSTSRLRRGRVDFGSLLAFSSFDTVLTASNSGFTGSTPSVTSFEISLTNSHSFLVSFVPFSMAASVSFVTSAVATSFFYFRKEIVPQVVRFLPLLQACVPLSGLCLFLIYCFPFGSFGMSLEISDAVDLPDLEPFADVVDPSMMPKFDMHLFTSTLGETHVEWITKAYDIPLDLLPRVALEGMTMDELPDDVISAPTSLKKWKYKFFFIDRRAIPIAMMWRHNDSSVVDLPPGYGEFEEGDVEKLRKVVVKLHKPYPSLLYVVGLATVWKHAGYNYLLNDPEGK